MGCVRSITLDHDTRIRAHTEHAISRQSTQAVSRLCRTALLWPMESIVDSYFRPQQDLDPSLCSAHYASVPRPSRARYRSGRLPVIRQQGHYARRAHYFLRCRESPGPCGSRSPSIHWAVRGMCCVGAERRSAVSVCTCLCVSGSVSGSGRTHLTTLCRPPLQVLPLAPGTLRVGGCCGWGWPVWLWSGEGWGE